MLPRPEIRDILIIVLLVALIGAVVYVAGQEERILKRLELASNPVIAEAVPPVETPTETPKTAHRNRATRTPK